MASYRERPGTGVVRCWWEQRVATPGLVQRVVPDGSSDLIVFADGEAVFVGPALRVALVPLPSGAHLRGVRFRTEALGPLLRLPARELRDATLPLTAVLPDRVARTVAEQVWAGRFPDLPRASLVDVRVRHAVRRLWSAEPAVADVAGELGVAERHLRRLFLDHTGMSPKAVQRVGRFQRFVRAVDAGRAGLAELAAEAGFADQAHLTREVRALAGLTPGAFLLERSGRGVQPPGTGLQGVGEGGGRPA
ncbi:AraC family transcriptional regulator [Amycolatopsis acidiphila]|uniref:Helix-turn-helix transcriptional regulator n=1 Tax=Amycolatopsis acidiphila TaxID=715473 RepID=A0A558A9A7_9PSEU|nr:AraC family transcriptional regulator [Amycolatopsis acidiphila]TVT20826.1 helix-turn-helix transcriptional regulator [Amycolatopsis acidiphila]UIJ58372.1 AraC family transcriptional regulator [Amycolatopsis acidiphila]GHG93687.1 AraC family transcriptional regulator [Amycolatopsis acidiphila]